MQIETKSENKVLVTGCDIDGIPRGKIINSAKLEHSESGFGFCNVVFGITC